MQFCEKKRGQILKRRMYVQKYVGAIILSKYYFVRIQHKLERAAAQRFRGN